MAFEFENEQTLSQPEELDGVTTRVAKFVVKNNTGKKIKSLDVYHKYSDDFKNHLHCEGIPNGSLSSEGSARYNTGAFTTGRDWWLVAWLDEDDKFYFTNPNNLRGFMDFMESLGKNWLQKMADAYDPGMGTGLAEVMSGLSTAIFVPMLNSTSTSGFKQHILRSEDTERTTEIILNPINSSEPVKFHSKSGDSVTVYKNGNIDDLVEKIKDLKGH